MKHRNMFCFAAVVLILGSCLSTSWAGDTWQKYELRNAGTIFIPQNWTVSVQNGEIYSAPLQGNKGVLHLEESLSAHPLDGRDLVFDLATLWLTDIDMALPTPNEMRSIADLLNVNFRQIDPDIQFKFISEEKLNRKDVSVSTFTYDVVKDKSVMLRLKYLPVIHQGKIPTLRFAYSPEMEPEVVVLANDIFQRWEVNMRPMVTDKGKTASVVASSKTKPSRRRGSIIAASFAAAIVGALLSRREKSKTPYEQEPFAVKRPEADTSTAKKEAVSGKAVIPPWEQDQ